MNLNKINLVGRVGKEPDVKYFESGSVLVTLTLAVNRATSKKDEPPDWFDLEIWGKTGEIAANYVKKGAQIGVEGSLRLEQWADKTTGAKRSTPRIKVDRLDLLGSKRDNENSGYQDPNTIYSEEF